jgi:hypothetical protein
MGPVNARWPRFALLAVVALGSLASCAPGTVGDTYALSGHVTQTLQSGVSSTPVGGAHVRFTSDVGDVVETTTGSDGRYRMQILTRVRFGQVRAEAAGFVPAERTVYFDTPERRIDLGLRPDTSMPMM